MRRGDRDRFGASRRREHVVAASTQYSARDFAQALFVIDDEDGFQSVQRDVLLLFRSLGATGQRVLVDRKKDIDARANAFIRIDLREAARLQDDSVDRSQAEARPFAPRFRGEKGFEGTLTYLGRHANAIVTELNADVRSRGSSEESPLRFGDVPRGCHDGERAAKWHGVSGIDREIEDYLFDVARIGHHVRQFGLQNNGKLDLF